jgi:methyl-accepting chemotaxis protein
MASFLLMTAVSDFYKYSTIRSIAYQMSRQNVQNELKAKLTALDAFFKVKLEIAKILRYNPELIQWLSTVERNQKLDQDRKYQEIVHYLNTLKEKDPDLKSIFFASDHSQLYYDFSGYVSESDYYLNNRPWYQEVKKKLKMEYSAPSIDLKDTSYAVSVNAPIFDSEGNFVGVTGIDLTLDKVIDILQSISVGEKSYVFAYGKDGTIYVHPDTSLVMKAHLADLVNQLPGIDKMADDILRQSENWATFKKDGEKFILYTQAIPTTKWGIALVFPETYLIQPVQRIKNIMQISTLLGFLFMGLIVLWLVRFITKPVKAMVARFHDLHAGEGDLTIRVHAPSSDEIGKLASLFNHFMNTLSSMFSNIFQKALGVNHKITGISEESQNVQEKIQEQNRALQIINDNIERSEEEAKEMHRHAEEQKQLSMQIRASLNEILESLENEARQLESLSQSIVDASASIEEISQSAQSIGDNMNHLASSSTETKELSNSGLNKMVEVESFMEEVSVSAHENSEKLISLGNNIQQIDSILRVINEIADQTNLLALNAAIEAARAGEHGRGFSIVAEEIRKLAEETSNATGEISRMITSIHDQTSSAVEKAKQNAEKSKEVKLHTEETKVIFDQIIQKIEVLNDAIHNINQAVNEQSRGLTSIADFIHNIKEIALQIKNEAENQAANSEQIRHFVETNTNSSNEIFEKSNQQLNRMEEIAGSINQLLIISIETEEFLQKLQHQIRETIQLDDELMNALKRFKFNGAVQHPEKSVTLPDRGK